MPNTQENRKTPESLPLISSNIKSSLFLSAKKDESFSLKSIKIKRFAHTFKSLIVLFVLFTFYSKPMTYFCNLDKVSDSLLLVTLQYIQIFGIVLASFGWVVMNKISLTQPQIKHCYNAVSPNGTCIVNAYCQFSHQECTNFMQTYLY